MTENKAENEFEKLPPRISRLFELANNLWWSWNEEGRQVFRALDYSLWRNTGHNPVMQLRHTSQEKLEAAARDPSFWNCTTWLWQSLMNHNKRRRMVR